MQTRQRSHGSHGSATSVARSGAHTARRRAKRTRDEHERSHLDQRLGLDLQRDASETGEREQERLARPQPPRARQHREREVDREREVREAALDVPPQFGGEDEQEQRARQRRGGRTQSQSSRATAPTNATVSSASCAHTTRTSRLPTACTSRLVTTDHQSG